MSQQQGFWVKGSAKSGKSKFLSSSKLIHFIFNDRVLCTRNLDISEFTYVKADNGKKCKQCQKILDTYDDLNNLCDPEPSLTYDAGFA